jgi:hypothetical protein
MKMQEQSFSKMQLEIASLQNKIKGLETKLSPYSQQQAKTQIREISSNMINYGNIKCKFDELPKQVTMHHDKQNTASFENKENIEGQVLHSESNMEE